MQCLKNSQIILVVLDLSLQILELIGMRLTFLNLTGKSLFGDLTTKDSKKSKLSMILTGSSKYGTELEDLDQRQLLKRFTIILSENQMSSILIIN